MTQGTVPASILEGLDTRCQLMLEVTSRILNSDPDLRLCEGLRLIEATRTAMGRMAPDALESFDAHVLPRLRSLLLDRFGISLDCVLPVN